jgi:excisionase family DNA binding protein
MTTNNIQINGLLRVSEAARLLYVHTNTLRRWTEQGIIKAYRIGPRGDRRFKAEDINVLLKEYNNGFHLDMLK